MSNLSIENIAGRAQIGESPYLTGRTTEVVHEQESAAELGGNSPTFAHMLEKSLEDVNTQQHQANTAINELVAGRNKNIHETMLVLERADASLKMAMQVRNKILDAYREIMRMQV